MSVFTPILAPIEPAPVRSMIEEKLDGVLALIQENNRRVARINEAKDTDPNNTEYLDKVWARIAAEESDQEIVAAEKRYQKAVAAQEKELAAMRAAVKARHISERPSEEEIAKLRKDVNDGKSVITTAVTAANSFAEMADQMLKLVDAQPKDKDGNPVGVITFMPQTDSLLNARGRKAASSSNEGGYATRLSEAKVDGKSTNKEMKRKGKTISAAHFNHVAETLSRMWDANQFPQNQVTALEVEEMYYASLEKPFRDSASMPEVHEFKFVKDVTVQNPNDDSTKTEPHTAVIEVTKWTAAGSQESDDENTDAKQEEIPANA
jgi:hypothetical protein